MVFEEAADAVKFCLQVSKCLDDSLESIKVIYYLLDPDLLEGITVNVI